MSVYYNAQRDRWIAQASHGDRRASKACATKAEARAAEAHLRVALEAEAAQTQAPVTLRAACDAYLAGLERRGKANGSVARAAEAVKALDAFFGPRMNAPLATFALGDWYDFRKARLAACRRNTVNRDLGILRSLLRAVDPDYKWAADLLPRQDCTRVRALTREQEEDILRRLPEPIQAMARLAALTLMREAEVRTLTREQVRLGEGIVCLPDSKIHPSTVALSSEARDLLAKQLDRVQGEYLFPSPTGGSYSRQHVSRAFHDAATAAGYPDFTFHDLRHSGASRAARAGASDRTLMRLGRWSDPRMLSRYVSVANANVRAAAESVADGETDCSR